MSSFLPTTLNEVRQRGWDALDVILVSGDSYIDSPYIGIAVIGRMLEKAGGRVGIIAQPDVQSPDDITRLGEPHLFWGISGGSVDSMVANYTALGKKRHLDDYTPGGQNNRRPDRAVITYCNLIRRYFKNTVPLVLGGIEASLRRVAHYDFWSNSIRRSILFDAKADYLLYGMADHSVLQLARALSDGKEIHDIKGLCFIAKNPPYDYLELPSFENVCEDRMAFIKMFHSFYRNKDPLTAGGLFQRHGDRCLVQNPPPAVIMQSELDEIYRLPFQRSQHPYYEKQGKVKALETIRFSISTHRGCYGECNFCAIAVHEGRTVRWRSTGSIMEEARILASLPDFKGHIHDVGGPTANMYGFECKKKLTSGVCNDRRCLYPKICRSMPINHRPQVELLQHLRTIPGVKKVFVASGIRHDMVLADLENGNEYLRQIATYHVSGQLKLAPEHSEEHVLDKMGKPGVADLVEFKKRFDQLSHEVHKKQFLTYYLIAAHPGCTERDMQRLKDFTSRQLHISPEQVQIFTPSPSTYSSLMYYTGMNPFSLKSIFVERTTAGRQRQKNLIAEKHEKAKTARFQPRSPRKRKE